MNLEIDLSLVDKSQLEILQNGAETMRSIVKMN